MRMGTTSRAGFAVCAMLAVALAGAVDPKAVEEEIKALKLSGAASNIHLLASPPGRVAAWREAALAGDPASEWLMGRCHDFGFTVPKDDSEAIRWYRLAADQGYARAQLSLGILTAAGRGTAKDPAAALDLYRKAAEQPSCPEAYERVIQAYNQGVGVPKDPAKVKELAPKAVAAYEHLAAQGYAGARMRLGRIVLNGVWGTPVDVEKGLALYRQGLAQGQVYCQTNMGDAYKNGQYGLPKDLAQAAKYFRMAVSQGEPIAKASLAEMYLDGAVPDPDPAEAERLYAAVAPEFRAEATKDAGSMYRLAQMTERGAGVPRDDAEAVALYRKAADAGSAPAALALADRYDSGRGVPKDPDEAARLREKAKAKKPG